MVNKKTFITVLIALLLVLGLIFVIGRSYVAPVKNNQQPQEIASVESAVSSESGSLRSPVGELDYYRQLSIGDSFTLQLGADNTDATAEVVVSQIALEGVIVSIVGSLSLPEKGSILMTIGEKFIHIFLTLDSGIYEYSGKDFQGVVSRTKDMRFNNDTAVLPNQSFELTDQPARQRAVPAEIAQ